MADLIKKHTIAELRLDEVDIRALDRALYYCTSVNQTAFFSSLKLNGVSRSEDMEDAANRLREIRRLLL